MGNTIKMNRSQVVQRKISYQISLLKFWISNMNQHYVFSLIFQVTLSNKIRLLQSIYQRWTREGVSTKSVLMSQKTIYKGTVRTVENGSVREVAHQLPLMRSKNTMCAVHPINTYCFSSNSVVKFNIRKFSKNHNKFRVFMKIITSEKWYSPR